MVKYLGYKYKISVRPDGRCVFAVWSAAANSRRDDPIWLRFFETRADGERLVKQWIDDRQPKARRRKRPRPKGRR
jgi:hypothetical protein